MKNLLAFLLLIFLHGNTYAQFEETEAQIKAGKFEEAFDYLISAKNYFLKNSDSITVFEYSEWIRMEALFITATNKKIDAIFLQSIDNKKARNSENNQKDTLSTESIDLMARLIYLNNSLRHFEPAIVQSKMMKKAVLSDLFGAIADCDSMIEKGMATTPPGAAYYWRGICQLQLGQKQKGCLDLSKAGELGYQGAYEKIRKFCK